jgi:hypothetical protein
MIFLHQIFWRGVQQEMIFLGMKRVVTLLIPFDQLYNALRWYLSNNCSSCPGTVKCNCCLCRRLGCSEQTNKFLVNFIFTTLASIFNSLRLNWIECYADMLANFRLEIFQIYYRSSWWYYECAHVKLKMNETLIKSNDGNKLYPWERWT